MSADQVSTRSTGTAATARTTTSGLPGRALVISAVLAAGAVLTQVAYPLVDGNPDAATNRLLAWVTVASVLLFCGATVAHAFARLGVAAAATLLVVAGGVGLLAESVGTATGFPFGSYGYTGTLGPQVLGVPVVVPLAWVMMAYPCLLAGRVLARRLRRPWLAVPAATWLLASWDLFLDPQMVHAGHWTWVFPSPGLPGVDGIPLTNFAGWLLVAAVIQVLLHRLLPDDAPGGGARVPAVPAALLAWTWLGSSLANLAFFDRPAVAAYGFVVMGLVAAPALASWLRR